MEKIAKSVTNNGSSGSNQYPHLGVTSYFWTNGNGTYDVGVSILGGTVDPESFDETLGMSIAYGRCLKKACSVLRGKLTHGVFESLRRRLSDLEVVTSSQYDSAQPRLRISVLRAGRIAALRALSRHDIPIGYLNAMDLAVANNIMAAVDDCAVDAQIQITKTVAATYKELLDGTITDQRGFRSSNRIGHPETAEVGTGSGGQSSDDLSVHSLFEVT